MPLFKLDWRQSFIEAVAPLRIVEHLDVVEDVLPGLIACRIDLAANSLSFQQLEKALGDCVVVAITAPAHALYQVVLFEEVAPVVTAELTSLIGMHRDLSRRFSTPYRHQQGSYRQLFVDTRTHRPTDDLA